MSCSEPRIGADTLTFGLPSFGAFLEASFVEILMSSRGGDTGKSTIVKVVKSLHDVCLILKVLVRHGDDDDGNSMVRKD